VLAGDHVLPTITPHIGGIGGFTEDLRRVLRPLERMSSLPYVGVALPAHGHPFTNLAKRVTEIEEHHIGRLARLRTASQEMGRAASVQELMQHLFAPRAWGSMAESETYAHLEHLRILGNADSEWVDGLLCYQVTA
jgi:hypothetical protein